MVMAVCTSTPAARSPHFPANELCTPPSAAPQPTASPAEFSGCWHLLAPLSHGDCLSVTPPKGQRKAGRLLAKVREKEIGGKEWPVDIKKER